MVKKHAITVIIIVALLLLAMNYIPGKGSQAYNQKKTATVTYSCSQDSDCPQCVSTEFTSKCESAQCVLPQECLKWDCGNQADCISIRNTVLDNIITWISDHPWYLFGALILFVVWLLLK